MGAFFFLKIQKFKRFKFKNTYKYLKRQEKGKFF